MKPFDLEAAKRGDPICTRDGIQAKFIAHVPEAEAESQLVILRETTVKTYYPGGNYYKRDSSAFDLFMAPKKRTVWVNLYRSHMGYAFYYDTEDKANKAADQERIGNKAWSIEIEE